MISAVYCSGLCTSVRPWAFRGGARAENVEVVRRTENAESVIDEPGLLGTLRDLRESLVVSGVEDSWCFSEPSPDVDSPPLTGGCPCDFSSSVTVLR